MDITTESAVVTKGRITLKPGNGKPVRQAFDGLPVGYAFRIGPEQWEIGCGTLRTEPAGTDLNGRRVHAVPLDRDVILASAPSGGAKLDLTDGPLELRLTPEAATAPASDLATSLAEALGVDVAAGRKPADEPGDDKPDLTDETEPE